MNSRIWEKIEKNRTLRVVEAYKEQFKTLLVEFQSSKSGYGKFGPFYELYLFAFVVGFFSKYRFKELQQHQLGKFNAVHEWKHDRKSMFKIYLSALLTDDSIRNETGFIFEELSNKDIRELDTPIKNLITVFEEYANGGFEILSNELSENPEAFDHFLSLMKIHEDILKE
jgi:hypothetical protein